MPSELLSRRYRCHTGLIGNPVKIGSGPAAVTLLLPNYKGERTLLAIYATVSINRDGKAAERAGESEDLPYELAITLRTTEAVVT